jgi:O-antigen/teichoic acid export membrane protein
MEQKLEPKQEFITFGRQVGYVIGASIVLVIVNFIQLPILTKELGPTLYGVWSLINVAIYLLFPFALLSLSVAIIRFLAAEKDPGRIREDFFSAYFIVGAAGIVLSLLLFFLSNFLADTVLKDANLSSYIRLASVLIFLNAMYQILINFFRIKKRIGLFTTINLIFSASQVGLIILFLRLGYGLTGAITALVIVGVLFHLIMLSIILKQIGFRFPRFSHMKEYLRWSIPLTPSDAIFWIIDTSDRYIVAFFLGVTAAGIYNSAYSIGIYAAFALTPLGTVMFPNVAKTYAEGNREMTRNYLSYSIKYLMMITIPAAFGLSILAVPLLNIITTPEFVSGSIVVPFIAGGAIFRCLYQIHVTVMNLSGKNGFVLILLGLAAGLNVLLNIILIPRLGILGAGLSTLVAYFVLGVLTLATSRRYFKADINLLFIAKSLFAAAVMALCIWLINPTSIISVVISIFVGIIVYFAILLLVKAFSKNELAFFTSLIKKNVFNIFIKKPAA